MSVDQQLNLSWLLTGLIVGFILSSVADSTFPLWWLLVALATFALEVWINVRAVKRYDL